MASNGYPGAYEKGSVITGIDRADARPDTIVFHAGTTNPDGDTNGETNGEWLAVGGRVLAVTALGDTPQQARRNAYDAVGDINWPGGFYRSDIAAK